MKYCILFCLLLCLLFNMTACQSKNLEVPTQQAGSEGLADAATIMDRNYYANMSPSEYLLHLEQVFVTLLPYCARDTELGVGSYLERFADDISGNVEMDSLIAPAAAGGTAFLYPSKMPVFYGLLRETEQYLLDTGATYNELALPYGKAYAIKGEDLQGMVNLLLRKEVALSFASAAGAEYIEAENLFVYDTLENPFQEYMNQGWTLEWTGSAAPELQAGAWGEADYCWADFYPFWYDAETAIMYNLYGEKLGYTHAIDLLRTEGSGAFGWCLAKPRGIGFTQYCVVTDYAPMQTITLDTPISFIGCGSINMSVGLVADMEQEGYVNPQKILELEQTFFDDYYRDPEAGSKVTNYFLASFYERPEDIDITLLPTQEQGELTEWCETYLGISAEELTSDSATVGTGSCETPYVAFNTDAQVKIDEGTGTQYYLLRYYNEIQRHYALLTLRVTDGGYQFVSNVPCQTYYW